MVAVTLSEAQLREQVLDWLMIGQQRGYFMILDVRHPNLRSLGREGLGRTPGIPDIIVLANYTPPKTRYIGMPDYEVLSIAIELKAKRGKLRQGQLEMSQRWATYGKWLTCKSLDEVKAGLVAAGVRLPEEA